MRPFQKTHKEALIVLSGILFRYFFVYECFQAFINYFLLHRKDITELNEREAVMKPGKARPASKVAIIMKRLNAAERNLNELAAFYPK